MDNLARLSAIADELPEAVRVDVEAWDGEPTFRVRNKTFLFSAPDGNNITVKLPRDEAEAVVASDPSARPAGYGLGKSGWVAVRLEGTVGEHRWDEVREWIRTSYRMVAPKRLSQALED